MKKKSLKNSTLYSYRRSKFDSVNKLRNFIDNKFGFNYQRKNMKRI